MSDVTIRPIVEQPGMMEKITTVNTKITLAITQYPKATTKHFFQGHEIF